MMLPCSVIVPHYKKHLFVILCFNIPQWRFPIQSNNVNNWSFWHLSCWNITVSLQFSFLFDISLYSCLLIITGGTAHFTFDVPAHALEHSKAVTDMTCIHLSLHNNFCRCSSMQTLIVSLSGAMIMSTWWSAELTSPATPTNCYRYVQKS